MAYSVNTRAKIGDFGWVFRIEAIADLLSEGRSLTKLQIEPERCLVPSEEDAYRQLVATAPVVKTRSAFPDPTHPSPRDRRKAE